MSKWWEEYECGCISKNSRTKKALCGYCPEHGDDRRALYKDGLPADEQTRDIHRRTFAAIAKEKNDEHV